MRLTSLFTALVLLWFGGSGVADGLSNREISEFMFARYASEKPDAEWVLLTDVGLDIASASYTEFEQGGGIHELLVPLRSADAELRGTVDVFLATTDPDMIHEFQKLQKVPTEEIETYYFENLAALFVTVPVEGMVEISFAQERGRKSLMQARADVAPDCALITHGKKPQPLGLSASMLGLGLLLLAAKFLMLRV